MTFRLAGAAHLQREGHIVEHGEMRKQGIGLENHRRAAPGRRKIGDVLGASRIFASLAASCPAIIRKVVVLPQPEGPRRRIASCRDFQADGVHGKRRAIALAHLHQFKCRPRRHQCLLSPFGDHAGCRQHGIRNVHAKSAAGTCKIAGQCRLRRHRQRLDGSAE